MKKYDTQTIVLYTSDLFVVHEVAVSGRTCTQPLSEIATVSVGCGGGGYLSWYPVAGVAFGAPGTCTQCTPQVTVISGGAQGTTLLCLNIHAACARALVNYLRSDTLSNGPRSVALPLYLAAKAPPYIELGHSATEQHEASLPGNASARG